MSGCVVAGCSRPLSTATFQALCGTHYQRRWRWGRAPRLPSGVEERWAYPDAEWLPSIRQENNIVHCMSRVLLVGAEDGWSVAPLCDPDAELRPDGGSRFRTPGRRCKRCEVVLRRVGLIE